MKEHGLDHDRLNKHQEQRKLGTHSEMREARMRAIKLRAFKRGTLKQQDDLILPIPEFYNKLMG